MIYLYADNINRVNLSMSEKNAPSKDQKAKLHVVNDKRFNYCFVNKLSAFCSISNSKVTSTHVPISSKHY